MTDNPSDDARNQRRARRVAAVLRVDYPHLTDFVADYSENLSKSGLFIATDRDHSVGEILTLRISFPGLLAPIVLRGSVRWVRRATGPDTRSGIGLELLFDEGNGQKQFARLVAEAEAAGGEAKPTRIDQPARAFRVLLAEDNPHVRRMFGYGLRRFAEAVPNTQIAIELCADGAEAWKMLAVEPFDLVIADINMPVLDGGALIQRIRATPAWKTMPIMVISAGGIEAKKEALAIGADIFLDKPVSLHDILSTIRTLLRLRV